jgi:hypothetical protein
VYFLTGRKLKRLVGSRDLREAAIDAAGVPPWLFESCYEAVGDLAETMHCCCRRRSRWIPPTLRRGSSGTWPRSRGCRATK